MKYWIALGLIWIAFMTWLWSPVLYCEPQVSYAFQSGNAQYYIKESKDWDNCFKGRLLYGILANDKPDQVHFIEYDKDCIEDCRLNDVSDECVRSCENG